MLTKNKEKVHFIGIGGIGMSAIAMVLKIHGFIITGSDIAKSSKTIQLEDLGIKVYYGHDKKNIEDNVTVVVNSTAISPLNQEMVEAKKRKIPIISRGEMLAEVMRLRYGIAISGAHGKTTTTSLISQILTNTDYNPICIIGGNHFNLKSNAHCEGCSSEFLVCEADESDGSFLKLSPVLNVVTNIDNDHLDYYENIENIRVAFLEFINKIPFYGASFLCFENEIVRDLAKSASKKYFSYGFSSDYDFYVDKSSIKIEAPYTSFKAYRGKNLIGVFKIPLLGEHNILNTLASIALSVYLDVDTETIKKSLMSFEGVARRLNILYDKEITIFDDYAHHPTEIKASLKALRDAYKNRRIIAIFQPHRYSRTKLLFNEFASAFNDSDIVIITEIYSAGEVPIVGITGEALSSSLREYHNSVVYIENMDEIENILDAKKENNDIIITLGAGNIVKVGENYAKRLCAS